MSEEIEDLHISDDSVLVWQETNKGRMIPFVWLFCAKPNCKNRTYRVVGSKFCYPHTHKDFIEQMLKNIALEKV